MTLDQIDRMVRQANPVPDLTALEPFEAPVLPEHRRMQMQTDDRVIVDPSNQKPRRGLIGIAAAAVIAVGALILFQSQNDRPSPATNPPTVTEVPQPPVTVPTLEIASSFVEAYAALDPDAAASYLAGAARASEEMRLLTTGWHEALFVKKTFKSCELTDSSPTGIVVVCPYDFHALRSDEIGKGPYTGSFMNLTVSDGKIVAISGTFNYQESGFSAQVWVPFSAWVTANYPDDVLVLYNDTSRTLERVTEDSKPVWEQRTKQWVEAVNSGATP